MKLFLYALSVLVLFFACKKEDNSRIPVLAGVHDAAMFYTELNPALQIAFVYDPILNIDQGKDSLDINQDGSYDIIIGQRNLLGTPPATTNPTDTYPFCSLHIRNGIELAIHNETYYIGHGQTSSVNWVDTIAYKTNLADLSAWSESDRTFYLWLAPPTIFWGSCGPWYNLNNKEKYVGFRMKINARYRYGWIRLMVTSRERMAFISYAVEK